MSNRLDPWQFVWSETVVMDSSYQTVQRMYFVARANQGVLKFLAFFESGRATQYIVSASILQCAHVQ